MVLAAGHGTRLRPLTDELPKALLPFGDRRLLEHALAALGDSQLPAVVNAHHLAGLFVELVGGHRGIAGVVVEPELRGTAGGVAGARALLGPAPIAVTNADVLAPLDVPALLGATPPGGLCLVVAARARGEGSVGLGEDGRVVRLRGERFGDEATGADYVGTLGIGADVLASLPACGCLIGDVALPLLRRGAPVRTQPLRGRWLAPGDSVADYLDAHAVWLAERGNGSGSYVAASARIDSGIELMASVVGSGARVEGRGRLERVVVWPGAAARAPLCDAVVTTAGRIVPRARAQGAA